MKLLQGAMVTMFIFGVALIVVLLTDCSSVRIGGQQHVGEKCPRVQKPVMWNWVQDNSACINDQRRTPPWAACTICTEYDTARVCTTYSQVSPEQLGPDAGWDEAQHALGCRHTET